MKKTISTTILVLFAAFTALFFQPCLGKGSAQAPKADDKAAAIQLPQPNYDGPMSLEKALLQRRSLRAYTDAPLTVGEISQLLWAGQGITEPKQGLRTAPSARSQYPLNLYLLAGKVNGLPGGLYRYKPQGHQLLRLGEADKKTEFQTAISQVSLKTAAAVLVLSGMSDKNGGNTKWIFQEAGHAAQNILLQAEALQLGAVVMGGFKDEDVRKVLNMPGTEIPVCIISLGKK